MTTRSYFDLGALAAAPVNPRELKDYQALVANHASCMGFWRFVEGATIVADKVTSVANWRTGGVPLAQATSSQQASLIADVPLGRSVAAFVRASATRYTATGLTFSPNDAWTIVAVAKPLYATANEHVAGVDTTIAASRGALYTSLTVAPAPVFRTYLGTALAQSAVQTVDQWSRVIASHPGSTAGHTPKVKVGAAAAVIGTASADNPASGAFVVGQSAALAYGGRLDVVMLFSIDLLLSGNADLLALVNEYLDGRYSGVV